MNDSHPHVLRLDMLPDGSVEELWELPPEAGSCLLEPLRRQRALGGRDFIRAILSLSEPLGSTLVVRLEGGLTTLSSILADGKSREPSFALHLLDRLFRSLEGLHANGEYVGYFSSATAYLTMDGAKTMKFDLVDSLAHFSPRHFEGGILQDADGRFLPAGLARELSRQSPPVGSLEERQANDVANAAGLVTRLLETTHKPIGPVLAWAKELTAGAFDTARGARGALWAAVRLPSEVSLSDRLRRLASALDQRHLAIHSTAAERLLACVLPVDSLGPTPPGRPAGRARKVWLFLAALAASLAVLAGMLLRSMS